MNSRYCVLFIFLMGVTSSVNAQTDSQADTLSITGSMRPLGIVQEEPRWNITSTDLFTGWISSGLYGFYGPRPKILLDGIPIDINYFGWQNLNMLPIFVNNIDEAQSLFAPQVYRQTLASAGLVNFKTEPVTAGFSAHAFYYIGNESKDPGPWAYDSLKMSPNIDRWGPDAGFALSYGSSSGWHAKGQYLFRNHKPKDLALNLRMHFTASLLGTNQPYVNHQIYINSQSGLLETGYRSSKWNIKARTVVGTNDDYLFLQPFGREIPAQTAYRQLAVQSNYTIKNWNFEARYILHRKTIDKRIDLHTYIFDWARLAHNVALSGEYNVDNFKVKPGIIYEQMQTKAPGLNQQNDKITTFYLNSSWQMSNASRLYLQNSVDYHNENYAGTLRLGSSLKIIGNWKINPEIYYTQVLPVRQHSFAYGVKRGYTFGDSLGIPFDRHVQVDKNKSVVMKFGNKFALGANVTLYFKPKFIHHYLLNVPWQVVAYSDLTNTTPGTFTVTQESGERLSLLAGVSHSISSLFEHSISFHLQQTLNSSERYKNYFKQIPDTKIQYQFDIYPTSGLRLSLNAVYRSSTEWVELEALEGKEYGLPGGIPIRPFTGTFHTKTPSYLNLSLSARKWFWDQHLSTQFNIQNLLDQEVRMHTMGAELAPKFSVKIALHF